MEGLKAKLTDLGLSINDIKSDMQNRLIEYYNQDVDEFGSTDGRVRSMFTLRYIEDSLSHFDESSNIEINQWLEDFEDNSETLGWDSLQKFIYCKQLLKGAARLFIRSQRGIKNFTLLKEALINEFGTKLASVEVHIMMSHRKKRQAESFRCSYGN